MGVLVLVVCLFDSGAFCWTETKGEGSKLMVVVVLPHGEDDTEGCRCE